MTFVIVKSLLTSLFSRFFQSENHSELHIHPTLSDPAECLGEATSCCGPQPPLRWTARIAGSATTVIG